MTYGLLIFFLSTLKDIITSLGGVVIVEAFLTMILPPGGKGKWKPAAETGSEVKVKMF